MPLIIPPGAASDYTEIIPVILGCMNTSKLQPDAMPTVRQGTVLATLAMSNPRTAKEMHVRSDVLWRMQEAGWVARTAHQEWYIKSAGHAALERWRNRPLRPERWKVVRNATA